MFFWIQYVLEYSIRLEQTYRSKYLDWINFNFPFPDAQYMALYTYIWVVFQINIHKYTSPMEHLALVFVPLSWTEPTVINDAERRTAHLCKHRWWDKGRVIEGFRDKRPLQVGFFTTGGSAPTVECDQNGGLGDRYLGTESIPKDRCI